MQKKANRFLRNILLIIVILLAPLILLGLLLAGLSILGEVQYCQIRNEIFSYVQENFDRIELTDM